MKVRNGFTLISLDTEGVCFTEQENSLGSRIYIAIYIALAMGCI